jgi:aryl-alcohol dehydrogenase-like predicted oxidoreductase
MGYNEGAYFMSDGVRPLGRSGILVHPLAFGGNVFGWTADETMSFRLLDEFVDGGFNLIDTADVYSNWYPGNVGGESETIIGNWMKLRKNRDKVVVATKVGHQMSETEKGLKKTYILEAVERSLRRLRTDYIDLYQTHKDDPETPVEETLESYDQLVKAGKVRVIGASNLSRERMEESLKASQSLSVPRYESVQPRYNLYDRSDFEGELQAYCVEHQLAVIPYFSLASGFLTGKYSSEDDLATSSRQARIKFYLNERGYRIVDALRKVAQEISGSPSQVAIAWLRSRPGITAPIASATNSAQLKDLLAGARLHLAPEQITFLTTASD